MFFFFFICWCHTLDGRYSYCTINANKRFTLLSISFTPRLVALRVLLVRHHESEDYVWVTDLACILKSCVLILQYHLHLLHLISHYTGILGLINTSTLY